MAVAKTEETHERRWTRRPPTEREHIAEEIARRMDKPVTVLGVLFLLLVLADTMSSGDGGLHGLLDVASWLVWSVFVVEFLLRLVIAPSTWGYLRRNWWQLAFLAVPFLRFLRVVGRLQLARLRPARMGRVISSAVRGARTATRKLSGRLAWLTAVTLIVVLATAELLYEFGRFPSFSAALHAAALASVTGEPTQGGTFVSGVLDVVLAIYSVVVFAALAGMLGAYFLEHHRERRESEPSPASASDGQSGPPLGSAVEPEDLVALRQLLDQVRSQVRGEATVAGIQRHDEAARRVESTRR